MNRPGGACNVNLIETEFEFERTTVIGLEETDDGGTLIIRYRFLFDYKLYRFDY